MPPRKSNHARGFLHRGSWHNPCHPNLDHKSTELYPLSSVEGRFISQNETMCLSSPDGGIPQLPLATISHHLYLEYRGLIGSNQYVP